MAMDLVLRQVLTSVENVSSIHVLDWQIEDIDEKYTKNYFFKISRISVTYRLRKEDSTPPKELRIFVKEQPDTPFHSAIREAGLYHKEVSIYTIVFPQMHALGAEHFTPKLYHFDDKLSLWLEDLSQNGYKTVDREQKLDVEHCIVAIKLMAKFHALSVKLEKTAGLSDSLKKCSLVSTETSETSFCSDLVSQQIPLFIDSIPQQLRDRYPNMVAELKNLTGDKVAKSLDPTGKFNVLNHGDFEINNLLFKYDQYGAIENVKVDNFEFNWWGSPAYDLTFFSIHSMKVEDYQQYFPLLLKVYINKLNKKLRKLDCPIYNMQRLLNDLDNVRPFALFTLGCVLPYIVCDPKEPIYLGNALQNGKMELDRVTEHSYKVPYFKEAAAKWFEYFATNGAVPAE